MAQAPAGTRGRLRDGEVVALRRFSAHLLPVLSSAFGWLVRAPASAIVFGKTVFHLQDRESRGVSDLRLIGACYSCVEVRGFAFDEGQGVMEGDRLVEDDPFGSSPFDEDQGPLEGGEA